MNYGFISIVPALLVIVFALATKRTFESLLLGTFATYIFIEGFGFLPAWLDTLLTVVTDRDVQWVVFVCGLFGSLIALLRASNGTVAFSRQLSRICHSARTSLVMTWIMGVLIFIDDYLNIITLGTCMHPLTDKYKEPREALAYVINSTGAPVCVLLPISTWAIFYASIFYQQPEIEALGYGSATATYTHVIPFTFYAIFTLIIVFLFAMKLLPKFGKMKKAYARVETEGVPDSPENEHRSDANGTLWDFLIPILLVIVLTILTDEMLIGLIIGLFSCIVLYIPRKLMTFNEYCDTFMSGFCELVPTIAVVIAAFIMQRAANDIGLPEYVIATIEPLMSHHIFPAIAFAIVSVLTFVTGSNWGIPAVCTPIIIPLGCALGVNPLLTMGAILSGGTFGSHACFYSDATLLTAKSCGITNMEHTLSQFPYALIGAGFSFLAFLIFGFLV